MKALRLSASSGAAEVNQQSVTQSPFISHPSPKEPIFQQFEPAQDHLPAFKEDREDLFSQREENIMTMLD